MHDEDAKLAMKLKEKDDERAIETDRSRTKRMGSE
jgi:hypothetical protein|tara:strand:+ start:595 stop:699 length:105 start_codon:yes stop_codon:yes gene_type:complete